MESTLESQDLRNCEELLQEVFDFQEANMFSFSKIHAFTFRKTGGTCSVSYGWSFNTEPSKTQEKVDYDEGGTKHSTK